MTTATAKKPTIAALQRKIDALQARHKKQREAATATATVLTAARQQLKDARANGKPAKARKGKSGADL
jgi:hypothetical protein